VFADCGVIATADYKMLIITANSNPYSKGFFNTWIRAKINLFDEKKQDVEYGRVTVPFIVNSN
jgi:hypothetical protein